MNNNDFRNFAVKHCNLNGLALDQYMSAVSASSAGYISPANHRGALSSTLAADGRILAPDDGPHHHLLRYESVNDCTANVIQAQLLYLDTADPGKDVSIYINSPGGSVYAGLGIYDTMQHTPSVYVATICTGIAASMAAVPLVAGEKGKRFALTSQRAS